MHISVTDQTELQISKATTGSANKVYTILLNALSALRFSKKKGVGAGVFRALSVFHKPSPINNIP